MRISSRLRPEHRVYISIGSPPPEGFTDATSADALVWTWDGDAVTSWVIKWGTTSGVYTETYNVADPNARAEMFSNFLTSSGDYYISVFAVDGGGEGDNTDEVAISYTA
jgi:hypothetical protein